MLDKDDSKKGFCKYCGTEIKKDSTFCKKCGKPIQANILPTMGFWESVEWKNVILGSVIGSVFGIICIILMFYYGPIRDNLLYFVFFLIVTLSSGLYAGYMVWGDMKKRILNGAIAGGIPFAVITIIYYLIMVFGSSYYLFVSAVFSYGLVLIILGLVFGALGSLIGVLINNSFEGRVKPYIGVSFALIVSFLIFSGAYGTQIMLDNQTKHFDNSYLSFDYPGSWIEYSNSFPQFGSSSINIATVGDEKNETMAVVFVTPSTTGTSLQDFANQYTNRLINNQGFKSILNQSISLNGVNGYEYIYETTSDDKQYRIRAFILEKNQNIYLFALTAPLNKYDQEQNHFNIIINSFKIKS